MTDQQISKYQNSLVRRFLWWGLWNQEKMEINDWKIVTAKIINIVGLNCLAFFAGAIFRSFLFKHEFITIESLLETYSMNIKFWKSLVAYSSCLYLAYRESKATLDQRFLVDMAYEYKYNFRADLNGTGIDELINEMCSSRFSSKDELSEKVK